MHYVYMLQCLSQPDQRYTDFTADLKTRLAAHNAGRSIHTAKYKPWELAATFAVQSERSAREFEHYLKTGSGKAFANKRLW